jgi:hypothetical protein
VQKVVILLKEYQVALHLQHTGSLGIMVIRVVEFQAEGTKLERFLPKNQHTQSKLINFENWFSGEMSKIGHHFSNKD